MTKTKPKLFVLIPDGVSLRNFAYSNFYRQGLDRRYDIVFWHNTPFDLAALGFNQLKLESPKAHWCTDILKNARKHIEISRFVERSQDPIYYKYLFPLPYGNLIGSIKSLLTQVIIAIFNSEGGLKHVRQMIRALERKTLYYKRCKITLEQHKPDLVYCSSQRSVLAIAPMLAAEELQIPNICFIFSWDNLPKATLDVTADYYHVWSEHMKKELLHYHPFVKPRQIYVTGTPQFEPHHSIDKLTDKEAFYDTYGLALNITYFCFSGDDVTTSPQDPLYLRDVAKAIRTLNTKGHQLGLIFRRCPVDFSDRYNAVISEFEDVIVVIRPLWKKQGTAWDTILPMPDDLKLLASLGEITAGVFNLGSSMVFDFAIHNKPCGYMNYHYNDKDHVVKGVHVYDYVHFRSMPSSDAVFWINDPQMISEAIQMMLNRNTKVVHHAQSWFQHINVEPYQEASSRIVKSISQIVQISQA